MTNPLALVKQLILVSVNALYSMKNPNRLVKLEHDAAHDEQQHDDEDDDGEEKPRDKLKLLFAADDACDRQAKHTA